MMQIIKSEKVIETYTHKGAIFELVERPETIYAGKSVFTDNLEDGWGERLGMSHVDDFGSVVCKVRPEYDVHVSINFWHFGPAAPPGYVFGREVISENQPGGVDVYKVPASLFLRMYSDQSAAKLIRKDTCAPWELFSYILHKIMPKYGFKEPAGTDYEIEIYEPGSHESGYAYVAVEKAEKKKWPGLRR